MQIVVLNVSSTFTVHCRKNCPYCWYACCQGDGCGGHCHCPEIPLRDQRGENSGENQAVGQRCRGRWVQGPDKIIRDGDCTVMYMYILCAAGSCRVKLLGLSCCGFHGFSSPTNWYNPMNYETFSHYFEWLSTS